MKKKKVTAGVIGVVFLFLAGVTLLLYPVLSQWLSTINQSITIRSFSNSIGRYSEEEKEVCWREANEYNERLWSFISGIGSNQEEDEKAYSAMNSDYWMLLDLDRNGIMGTISIPLLSIHLPIYHGTDETVLSRGAGHLQNTSLPVGGLNTHTVISAHTGFPKAAMFDRLTELKEGDLFFVTTLEQKLVYRVSEIQISSPYDFTGLMIQEGEDLCTLVTCYPYGINTHRLLVTGQRVEKVEEEEEPLLMEEEPAWIVSPCLLVVPIVVVLILVLSTVIRKRRNRLKWRRPFMGS